ncbi:MAG: hypothetical protein KGH78_02725, partial [Candidatus Micrarchaeota archaeon]|nr:hypothetical protein [Candidatus Micrarchaeota archaeon]
LTDIAKTIQRHKSSIKSYLESKGVEYNKNWSVVTSEEGRKIGAMAHEGKNPNEIAREIKRDPVTVKTYLVKNKIPHTKGFKDVSEEEISEIFRLAGEGKGSRVISKELNLPRSTVRHYLKKHTEKSKDNGVNYNRTPYDPKYKIRILPFVDKEAADQVREMVKQKDVQ